MIVITGSVTARADTIDLLRREAVAHSERSRREDGCVSHRCYLDAEDPLRLFFYEEWRDMAAVQAHFRHADTPRLMDAIRNHAAGSEGPALYEASAVAR